MDKYHYRQRLFTSLPSRRTTYTGNFAKNRTLQRRFRMTLVVPSSVVTLHHNTHLATLLKGDTNSKNQLEKILCAFGHEVGILKMHASIYALSRVPAGTEPGVYIVENSKREPQVFLQTAYVFLVLAKGYAAWVMLQASFAKRDEELPAAAKYIKSVCATISSTYAELFVYRPERRPAEIPEVPKPEKQMWVNAPIPNGEVAGPKKPYCPLFGRIFKPDIYISKDVVLVCLAVAQWGEAEFGAVDLKTLGAKLYPSLILSTGLQPAMSKGYISTVRKIRSRLILRVTDEGRKAVEMHTLPAQ